MDINKNEKESENEFSAIKKPGLIKRMSMTGQITRLLVYLASTIPAIICIFFAIFSFVGTIQPITIPIEGGSIKIGTSLDFIIIAVIIFTGKK